MLSQNHRPDQAFHFSFVIAGGGRSGNDKRKMEYGEQKMKKGGIGCPVAPHLTVVIGATSNLGSGSLPWTSSWLLWLSPCHAIEDLIHRLFSEENAPPVQEFHQRLA